MSIFDRFSNQFGSLFGVQAGGPNGTKPQVQPQTMAEWKTLVDGMSPWERSQHWPGMHKDLIPATEMIDAMNGARAPDASIAGASVPSTTYPIASSNLPVMPTMSYQPWRLSSTLREVGRVATSQPFVPSGTPPSLANPPQTMTGWKSLVDDMPRHERDQLWPGMHKDLIPATEMIEASGLPGSATGAVSKAESSGVPAVSNFVSNGTGPSREIFATPSETWEGLIDIDDPVFVKLETRNINTTSNYRVEISLSKKGVGEWIDEPPFIVSGNAVLGRYFVEPQKQYIPGHVFVAITPLEGELRGELTWEMLPAALIEEDETSEAGPSLQLAGPQSLKFTATEGTPWSSSISVDRPALIGISTFNLLSNRGIDFDVEILFWSPDEERYRPLNLRNLTTDLSTEIQTGPAKGAGSPSAFITIKSKSGRLDGSLDLMPTFNGGR